jgi:predicted enzyme related to lactoylglutathione lyase
MDKVQHFEIPADDIARAKKFYETVFDWKIVQFPMPGMEYYGMHTGPMDEKNMPKEPGFINGGMYKRGGQFLANGPVVAMTSTDLKATIEKLKAAGGSTVGEVINIGGMGLYQYAKDTEGNMLGIWQDLKKA